MTRFLISLGMFVLVRSASGDNFLGLLWQPGIIYSNGYFVDSVSGNDSNTGRLPTSPLKTLSSVPQTLTNIWLAKGSFFRDQITVSNSGETFDVYGSGAMPIIDCSDVVTQSFTKTSGLTNTYQFSLTFQTLVPGNPYLSMWENSNRMSRATGLTNCDANASTYWVTNDSVSPSTIFVHASDGGNPASNGKVYETATRAIPIDAWRSGVLSNVTVRGILCRRNLDVSGCLTINGTADGCWAVDGNRHSILFNPGSTLTGCVVSNWSYASGGPAPLVSYAALANGEVSTITNCLIVSSVYDSAATGLIGHNDSGYQGGIKVLNSTFLNMGECSQPDGRIVVFSGCTISNVYEGIDSDNWSLLVTNTYFWATHIGVQLDGGLASSNYIIGCSMTNPACSYSFFIGPATSVLIQGNTLNSSIYASSGTPTITAKTNTFYPSITAWQIVKTNQAVADYNSYGTSDNFLSSDANSGGYMTFTQWKQWTGQDAHSTNP